MNDFPQTERVLACQTFTIFFGQTLRCRTICTHDYLTQRHGARSKNDRCARLRTARYLWQFKTHIPYHLALSAHFLCTSSMLPCTTLLLTIRHRGYRHSITGRGINPSFNLCSDMIRELLGPRNPESATHAFSEGIPGSGHRVDDHQLRFTLRNRRSEMNRAWPLEDHTVKR